MWNISSYCLIKHAIPFATWQNVELCCRSRMADCWLLTRNFTCFLRERCTKCFRKVSYWIPCYVSILWNRISVSEVFERNIFNRKRTVFLLKSVLFLFWISNQIFLLKLCKTLTIIREEQYLTDSLTDGLTCYLAVYLFCWRLKQAATAILPSLDTVLNQFPPCHVFPASVLFVLSSGCVLRRLPW
jgi:hypothetical protein